MVMFFLLIKWVIIQLKIYESDDNFSVGTEDSYDTESLCSNDSYESSFTNDTFLQIAMFWNLWC